MKGYILDWLYPRHCEVCGKELDREELFLCRDCLEDMPLTYFWKWRGNPAEKILWGRCRFETVSSLFYYHRENDYSHLTPKIKYNGNRRLGLYLGGMLGHFMKGCITDVDLIVPVPLHPLKKWSRGYNQSEIIAKGISEGLGGVPIAAGILKRRRWARSQTRTDMGNKWDNVESAFSLDPDRSRTFTGRHVLLVDDVLTSGATAEACWNTLKDVPGIKLSFATLAYVE